MMIYITMMQNDNKYGESFSSFCKEHSIYVSMTFILMCRVFIAWPMVQSKEGLLFVHGITTAVGHRYINALDIVMIDTYFYIAACDEMIHSHMQNNMYMSYNQNN